MINRLDMTGNLTKGMMVLFLGAACVGAVAMLSSAVALPVVISFCSFVVVEMVGSAIYIAAGAILLSAIGAGVFYKLNKSVKEAQNRERDVFKDSNSKRIEKQIQK